MYLWRWQEFFWVNKLFFCNLWRNILHHCDYLLITELIGFSYLSYCSSHQNTDCRLTVENLLKSGVMHMLPLFHIILYIVTDLNICVDHHWLQSWNNETGLNMPRTFRKCSTSPSTLHVMGRCFHLSEIFRFFYCILVFLPAASNKSSQGLHTAAGYSAWHLQEVLSGTLFQSQNATLPH